MLSRLRWVWLTFILACPVVLSAEVSLWCVMPEGEFPVVGSDHDLVVIKKDGALKSISPDSEFRLKGDVVDSSFAVLAPGLPSRKNELGRLSKSSEPMRTVTTKTPWSYISRAEWDASAPWGKPSANDGLLVLAWYDGSQELNATVAVFDKTKIDAYRAETLSLRVPEAPTTGFLTVLFMEAGKWREPNSWFMDPTMKGLDRAIARSDLKTLGAAVSAKGAVLKNQARLDGATLLDLAVQMNRPDCIEFLLRNGAQIETESAPRRSTLRRAIAVNSEQAVQKLLEHGAKVNSGDSSNESPLAEAVRVNNPALIKLLLAHGADPSMQDVKGVPPASLTAECGSLQVFKLLESVYPKYDYKGERWNLVLGVAVDFGYVPLVDYWISKGASPRGERNGKSFVQTAVINQDFGMLALLLRSGVSPNATGSVDKRAPVEIAVTLGSTDITRLLLEKGVTVDGDKLLAMAATVANLEQVNFLLKSGFQVSEDPTVKVSALDVAILFSSPSSGPVIEAMLASKAHLVRERSTYGAVLESALLQDRAEVIESLLKQGVSPDFEVRAGWPLSAAAKALKLKRCQALFESSGAKANAPYSIESPKALDGPVSPEHTVPFRSEGFEEEISDHPVVMADLIIDPQGKPVWIKTLDVIPPRLRILFESTVMTWTFTKPVKGGAPVGVKIRAPFNLPVDDVRVYLPKQVDVLPGPTGTMAAPVYPYKLKSSGVSGNVVVKYVVTTDGTTKRIEIVDATEREFAESVFQAVLKWKFKPAIRNGHPVNVQIAQQLDFKVDD